MLISFIGCPGSGKTTLACKLFTLLKQGSLPCELLLEQARLHIAERRALRPEEPLVLDDNFQHGVMNSQIKWEKILVASAGPKGVVVTDSSPLNTLLYLKDLDLWYVEYLASRARNYADLVFYCPPVPQEDGADPNRVHDHQASLAIAARVPFVLGRFAPEVLAKMHILNGDFAARYSQLVQVVSDHLP